MSDALLRGSACELCAVGEECIHCAQAERDRYMHALEEIASRPVVERNPDGDDQAAHTMQMIAREALDA